MPRGQQRQTFMFSATFPSEIQTLAADFLRTYVWIAVGRVGSTVDNIKQQVLLSTSDPNKKLELLLGVLEQTDGRTLVFVQKRKTATWLCDILRSYGVNVEEIHGDRSQAQRENALKMFRDGNIRILIATDVAARGLDVPAVKHVIQFDMPLSSEDFDVYVHRIGRTGRAGSSGLATSFYVPGREIGEGNGKIARQLLALLQENNQEVPDWFANCDDLHSGGGGGGGGYGSNYRRQPYNGGGYNNQRNARFGYQDTRSGQQTTMYQHSAGGFGDMNSSTGYNNYRQQAGQNDNNYQRQHSKSAPGLHAYNPQAQFYPQTGAMPGYRQGQQNMQMHYSQTGMHGMMQSSEGGLVPNANMTAANAYQTPSNATAYYDPYTGAYVTNPQAGPTNVPQVPVEQMVSMQYNNMPMPQSQPQPQQSWMVPPPAAATQPMMPPPNMEGDPRNAPTGYPAGVYANMPQPRPAMVHPQQQQGMPGDPNLFHRSYSVPVMMQPVDLSAPSNRYGQPLDQSQVRMQYSNQYAPYGMQQGGQGSYGQQGHGSSPHNTRSPSYNRGGRGGAPQQFQQYQQTGGYPQYSNQQYAQQQTGYNPRSQQMRSDNNDSAGDSYTNNKPPEAPAQNTESNNA